MEALPAIISYFRSHGYTFVNLAGNTGTGYHTPWQGSMTGIIPPGQSVTGIGPE